MRQLTDVEQAAMKAALKLHHGDNTARPQGNTTRYFELGYTAGLDAQRTALDAILAEWRKFADHPNPANPIACAAVRECIEDLEKVLEVTK